MKLTMNSITAPVINRAAWFALFALMLASAARAQFYAVSDLGMLGGTDGMAFGINGHEQIVGVAQTAMGDYHGFMFDGGRMIDLGTLGGSNSSAYAVNDHGWIVGGANMPNTNMHAFLCTNTMATPVMMDLGTLGGSNSVAWMVNSGGDMVGWAAMTNGSHHAFFMTNSMPGSMMDLGTAGGTNSEAYCINSNGMVVGYAMMAGGTMEPIASTNAMMGSSSMMTMGMGGMGAAGGQSWYVNDNGVMVGQAQMAGGNHHAFVSGGGGMMGGMTIDLGTLGGTNSAAYCINKAGNVVGMAELSNGVYHAFMATNVMGGMVRMMDLNHLVPTNSGWELMVAHGMNEAGQIIGWGMHGGHTNAFLLTPVSAPVMMMSGPAPQIVGPGTPVVLRMQMSASEPLSYQWLHNGMAIPGATNSSLSLGGMNMASAGQYTATVRNAMGTVGNSSAAVSMFEVMLTNGAPRLVVAAPTGSRFRIDYSDSLETGADWQAMTNFTMMSSMHQMGVSVSPGAHAGFYRAVMMP